MPSSSAYSRPAFQSVSGWIIWNLSFLQDDREDAHQQVCCH
ncbi:hypothetical protein EVA_07724 [gut metagenome]|uniref:Uncharacterized protein n=1 Tax=gut metagenome TaxID=749906 RepID=J9GBE8_9ZZZZ